MVVIHKNERTKVKPIGGAIYLSPRPYVVGSGLYLNRNGDGLMDIFSSIGGFIRDNKDIITTTAQAGSHIASAASNIKQAVDNAKKIDLIREIAQSSRKVKTPKTRELTSEQKRIIDEALGNGLKRF